LRGLNSDGSLDLTFNPPNGPTSTGANGRIRAIALDTQGQILIGGDFTSYDSTTVGRIARLNATDGSLDTSFDPVASAADQTVYGIAVDNHDNVLVVGDFKTIGGFDRVRIAQLVGQGRVPEAWTAG